MLASTDCVTHRTSDWRMAWIGAVPVAEPEALLDALVARSSPPPQGGPWAAFAWHPSGRWCAVVGPRRAVSLSWATAEDGTVLLGTHPREVLSRMGERPGLELELLRGDNTGEATAQGLYASPWREVRTLPVGCRLDGAPGTSPIPSRWSHPETTERHPESRLAEAVENYRRVLLEVVADAVASGSAGRVDDPALLVSGGLDSTAVAAVAARVAAGEGRVLHGWCLGPSAGSPVPHPDLDLALLLAERTPGLDVAPWANLTRLAPIDLLGPVYDRTWAPIHTPASLVWTTGVARAARSAGATRLLSGQAGNMTFSHPRQDAWRALMRSGHAVRTWRLVRQRAAATGRNPVRTAAELLAPPAVERALARRAGTAPRMADRATWLGYLRMTAWTYGADPAARGLWFDDPLSDARLVAAAARLPDSAWLAGGLPRGLARTVTEGLLPDEIRLNPRKILPQVPELPDWVSDRREDHERLVSAVEGSETARALVDPTPLRAWVDDWPTRWTQATATDYTQSLLRPLTLASYGLWWEQGSEALATSRSAEAEDWLPEVAT